MPFPIISVPTLYQWPLPRPRKRVMSFQIQYPCRCVSSQKVWQFPPPSPWTNMQPALVFHQGQSYHPTCANFRYNAVQEELPSVRKALECLSTKFPLAYPLNLHRQNLHRQGSYINYVISSVLPTWHIVWIPKRDVATYTYLLSNDNQAQLKWHWSFQCIYCCAFMFHC